MTLLGLGVASHLVFWLLPWMGLASGGSSPAVLVPGDGSSALEIRYQDMSPPHWWCTKSSQQWERLWIPKLSELAPGSIDCWSQKMKLHYNATSGEASNAPGVLGIRAIRGAAGLQLMKDKPSVFQKLLEALPDDLKVATYDFRLSPKGNPGFLQELKETIESACNTSSTTDNNKKRKATLVSHSLGGLVVHHFLASYVTDGWKATYVKAWVPLAPAYGGTKITLKQLVSGDAESVPWLQGKDVKEEQRSYETSVWLLPSPHLYSPTEAIVSSKSKNYTVGDYAELFSDAGFDNFALQWDRVKDLTLWENDGRLKDPKVAVYPVYGSGVDTVEQYVYGASLEEEPKQIDSPAGDGTVNRKSLEAGNHWALARPPLTRQGVDHTGVLSDPRVVRYVKGIVAGEQELTTTSLRLFGAESKE